MNDARADNIVDACAEVLKSPSAADFIGEIQRLLIEAQAKIDSHNPSCAACGRCCMFDIAGHRLYVSTGELALLASTAAPEKPAPLRCQWQSGGGCVARDTRPLGCRVFYCKTELNEIYEKFHRKIVDTHKKYGVPYFYAEMTIAAEALQQTFAKK